jgi:hypothetical protein
MRIIQGIFYKRLSKYSGLEASKFKRMKDLGQQLSECKTKVAKLFRDNRVLKNLIEKNFNSN